MMERCAGNAILASIPRKTVQTAIDKGLKATLVHHAKCPGLAIARPDHYYYERPCVNVWEANLLGTFELK